MPDSSFRHRYTVIRWLAFGAREFSRVPVTQVLIERSSAKPHIANGGNSRHVVAEPRSMCFVPEFQIQCQDQIEFRRSLRQGSFEMNDVCLLMARVTHAHPDYSFRQLQMKHLADDVDLWYFEVPGRGEILQLEAPNGSCPILIEYDSGPHSSERVLAMSVDEAFIAIERIVKM